MGKEIQKDNKKDNGDNFWNFLSAIAFVYQESCYPILSNLS